MATGGGAAGTCLEQDLGPCVPAFATWMIFCPGRQGPSLATQALGKHQHHLSPPSCIVPVNPEGYGRSGGPTFREGSYTLYPRTGYTHAHHEAAARAEKLQVCKEVGPCIRSTWDQSPWETGGLWLGAQVCQAEECCRQPPGREALGDTPTNQIWYLEAKTVLEGWKSPNEGT